MADSDRNTVWVFQGAGARLTTAVFASEAAAREWIRTAGVTGLLTEYPLGESHYDWAVREGYFVPKDERQRSPAFIQAFTSGHAHHVHFEDGESVSD